MSVFDVRQNKAPIEMIQFADEGTVRWSAAYKLTISTLGGGSTVSISDQQGDFVLINDKQHALDLVAAINKAIELSWLK